MSFDMNALEETYIENFLRYVKIPTASDPTRISQQPSTEEQWDLAKLLKDELIALGAEDVELDDYCYVYGYFNKQNTKERIVLLGHVDVSWEAPCVDIKPIIHRFAGEGIKLREDVEIPLTQLQTLEHGDKVITSDGTTLLGADDKAGISMIMTLLKYMKITPDMPSLCICFTPDEEIGNGVGHIRLEKLTSGIKNSFGVTLDGGRAAKLVFETFSAYCFDVEIKGSNIHPGYAYGKMINSIKYAAELTTAIVQNFKSAEQSQGTESYILVNGFEGEVGVSHVKGYIRTFDNKEMEELCNSLRGFVQKYADEHKEVKIQTDIKFQYKNMREFISDELIDKFMEVGKEFGSFYRPTRGGTDGSRLSEMGLPTPDLWIGTENLHSVREFNVVKECLSGIIFLAKLIAYK